MFKSVLLLTLCAFALTACEVSHHHQPRSKDKARVARQIPSFNVDPLQLGDVVSGVARTALKTVGGLIGMAPTPDGHQSPQMPQAQGSGMPGMSGQTQMSGPRG